MYYSINYETNRKKNDFTKIDLQKIQNIFSAFDATVCVEYAKFLLTFAGIKDTFSQHVRTQCT